MSSALLFASRSAPRSQDPKGAPVQFQGAVLCADRFLQDAVIAVANGRIVSIDPPASAAPCDIRIQLPGLMVAGLVDTHNHAPYAVFQRWTPRQRMRGRFEWRGRNRCRTAFSVLSDFHYRDVVAPAFTTVQKTNLVDAIRYGQVRGLIGGTTTMVIDADTDPNRPQSGLDGFVRDNSDWSARVWGVLDVGCVDESSAKVIAEELRAGRAKLLVHLGEGFDDFSLGEFRTLVARELLTPHTALIHGNGLSIEEWRQVAAAGASVIWSPRSNFRLYGRSLDIGLILGANIPIALAPDWTLSGSSCLLDEMTFVRETYPWIDAQTLVRMVTTTPASILGLDDIGQLSKNSFADFLVLDGAPTDLESAYRTLVETCVERIHLVVIGGEAVCGTERMMSLVPGEGTDEQVEIKPLVKRILRWRDPSHSVSMMLGRLRPSLAHHGLTVAPLWESDKT